MIREAVRKYCKVKVTHILRTVLYTGSTKTVQYNLTVTFIIQYDIYMIYDTVTVSATVTYGTVSNY